MKQNNLRIVEVSITSLNPAPYNPRFWDKTAQENLKESIKRFGLVDPIIVNSAEARKNIVIGGHFRLEMAKELGYTTLPVLYLNIPDELKEKELNLRLNRNTGVWDMELLKDFDIDTLVDIGFDDADLSDIWDDQLETEEDNFSEQKELEKIEDIYVKLGDIYQLGKHRIMCGDSTAKTAKQLVGDVNIDMVYTDPIYNLGVSYDKGIGGKSNYGGTVNDNKSYEEYREFLKLSMQNALDVMAPDAHMFYYCDQNFIGVIQELYRELGIQCKRVALWLKNGFNVTPQVCFNKCYEPVVYGTIGKPYLNSKLTNLTEVQNKYIDGGNRMSDDILDMLDLWLVKRLPGQEYQHSTQKPVTLHEKSLRRCTKPGDNVLDLFGGSGSTLIACEQLNRRAFLIEIEPIFVQLTISRYETLTGQKAKRIN